MQQSIKYSKAPISEVIMGIVYNTPKIPVDFILKNALFCEDFPDIEIVPPLSIETLKDFKVIIDNNSCPLLVRRWSSDKKWLFQIQANMIFLNWIRLDNEPVGTYGGFSSIKSRFQAILASLENITKIDFHSNILLCELTYYDRVKWQPLISDLSEIEKIMYIKTPPKFSEQGYNNIFSRYTFHDSELNGFGFININTDTDILNNGEQVIKLESVLKGSCSENNNFENWFEKAHTKQFNIFENIFTREMKEKWV